MLSKQYSARFLISPFSRGKNRISQGVENRGSLIGVPLALMTEASEKVTEKRPKVKKSDRTPFANLLVRHPDLGQIPAIGALQFQIACDLRLELRKSRPPKTPEIPKRIKSNSKVTQN